EQADWKDDTDDEFDDQELEAHYMYMAELQQIDQNDEDADLTKERELLASLIVKLKCEIDESKNQRSRVSHIIVQKEKKSFNKQPTLLEKRLDESIPLSKQCRSSLELFNVTVQAITIFKGVEMCKNLITKNTYFGYLDPFIKNTIEQNFSPEIERILTGLNQFKRCLKEEMVADLRYFNSLEFEVDSLRSQLETQKTQFSIEIDRLSREYFYADHMNAILGVYTEFDEGDRVMHNNSREKKLEVEEHRRNVKLPKNKTSVTACNDSLNAKTLNLVEIILFIVDSGCSKHMTGNLKLLINFVEKFLGTVKFGNDQIAPILGYGDLVQGAITIKRVYYVEGLNHNLFSVGQFCDADLEVAFRKSTCFIHDLKGNDLLLGILHQTFVARTPEQKGVVERRNRTLVEAARTMLSAAKVPLFFWAEAIATACFTQNRSLVIPRHEKTPYHIINDRKSSVKFFYIFGSVCYIVRDGENLDKIKEKGDECIFVGYSTQSKAYRVFNKRTRVIMESIYVNFDELPQIASDQNSSDPAPECQNMASDQNSSDPAPECQTMALNHDSLSPTIQRQEKITQADRTLTTSNELDLLFSLMFD
nr:retrovirus-related Pol polyprotein from transposon TNT 1-94 [Tanacetum cinerariifolium]